MDKESTIGSNNLISIAIRFFKKLLGAIRNEAALWSALGGLVTVIIFLLNAWTGVVKFFSYSEEKTGVNASISNKHTFANTPLDTDVKQALVSDTQISKEEIHTSLFNPGSQKVLQEKNDLLNRYITGIKSSFRRVGIKESPLVLFDGNPESFVRMTVSNLVRTSVEISFYQSANISAISLYRPEGVDFSEYITQLDLQFKYQDSDDWGRSLEFSISPSAGETYLDVKFDEPVTELKFSPKSNAVGYGYTTFGDVYIYGNLNENQE